MIIYLFISRCQLSEYGHSVKPIYMRIPSHVRLCCTELGLLSCADYLHYSESLASQETKLDSLTIVRNVSKARHLKIHLASLGDLNHSTILSLSLSFCFL